MDEVTATSIFGDKAPPPKKENPTLQLFTTEVNSTIGRHMVASEDIRAGTVIMRKKPLVLGPKLASEPVCLGCHQKLDFLYEECSRCGWPLCCQECENSKLHRDECEVFKRSGYKPNIESLQERQLAYTAVTPLRCLLLKTTAPSKYEELTSFQSHLEEHTKTPLYHILKRRLLPFFNAALKFPVAQEELLTVYSILDTNSFEIRDVRGKINIRGLYTAANLLTHRCKHNTKHSFHGEDLEMVVTATVPVKKGGLIAATYTQTLWGTLSRRRHLKRSKHFDCGCGRCRDPTEFGTYAGSMYCSQCRRDDRRDCCPKMVSEDPLDEDAMWRCERCEHVISGRQMAWNNDAMREGIKDLERYPWEFERFLEIHEDQLHPTNCHALDVKYALTQMYSEMMTDISDELLERQIELCQELLKVAEVLEPGFSKFRGLLLYDLQTAVVVQAKRRYGREEIRREDVEKIMVGAGKMLAEAAQILMSEPDMCNVIHEKMRALNEMLSLRE